MEGGVEARDRGQLRELRRHRVQRRQRLRLVKRGELGQRPQLALDLGVDDHRLAEPLAAVNDAVANRVSIAEALAQRRSQGRGVELRARSLQLARPQ